jgi:N-methylhydantoinase A
VAIRVGVDTGGTFTDLIGIDEETGRLILSKRPSTPAQPDRAVLDALDRSAISGAELSFLILGTTIAANALLQKKGARVLYLTTQGFEDVPFIQRIHRKFHYDLTWRKPEPFIERRDAIGVAERVTKDGAIFQALDEAALNDVARQIEARLREDRDGRSTALAINLLFAYANPDHEIRLRRFLEERIPGVPVSVSHQVAPIWREYERGSTVIADAFVKPLIADFVSQLDASLRDYGLQTSWAVMKSNGSNALARSALDQPVQLILSGLAGGMVAGKYFGEQVGTSNVISLDMGGTSTDVGVVTGGEIGYTTEYQIEWGVPIAAPFIDLTTIGAGGGSIAWVDRGGFLKVGPKSAGAIPGPICYNLGGREPTVTDANLVLGRLDPAYFLGGEIPLDLEQARTGLRAFGGGIGLSLEETALAIIELANENMANTIRLLTVERGIDPRDYDLVAFGGAGPLHGAELAAAAGVRRVLVPPHPGYGSAFGALLADLRVDRMWTHAYRSSSLDVARIDRQFRSLVDSALAEIRSEGFSGEPLVQRSISMRYLGQNYEQNVAVPEGPITEVTMAAVFERFHAQHEQFYGYRIAGEVIELIHFNVSTIGPVARIELPELPDQPLPQPISNRLLYFRTEGYLPTAIYRRSQLGRGSYVVGPAVVEEADSTTLVPPGVTATTSSRGVLVLDRLADALRTSER